MQLNLQLYRPHRISQTSLRQILWLLSISKFESVWWYITSSSDKQQHRKATFTITRTSVEKLEWEKNRQLFFLGHRIVNPALVPRVLSVPSVQRENKADAVFTNNKIYRMLCFVRKTLEESCRLMCSGSRTKLSSVFGTGWPTNWL